MQTESVRLPNGRPNLLLSLYNLDILVRLVFQLVELKLYFDNTLFKSLLLSNLRIINVKTIEILILIIVAIFIIVVLATFFFLLRISLFTFPTSQGLDIEKNLVVSLSWRLYHMGCCQSSYLDIKEHYPVW